MGLLRPMVRNTTLYKCKYIESGGKNFWNIYFEKYMCKGFFIVELE